MKLIQDLGYLEYGTQKRKAHYGIFECPKCNDKVKTTFYNVKRKLSTGCYSCGKNEASRNTNISQGNIGMALRGERKTAGGFIWKR